MHSKRRGECNLCKIPENDKPEICLFSRSVHFRIYVLPLGSGHGETIKKNKGGGLLVKKWRGGYFL
jgi:hypothetical protein